MKKGYSEFEIYNITPVREETWRRGYKVDGGTLEAGSDGSYSLAVEGARGGLRRDDRPIYCCRP